MLRPCFARARVADLSISLMLARVASARGLGFAWSTGGPRQAHVGCAQHLPEHLPMSALLFTAFTAAAALPSARILDATGSPSNMGLLQVQTEFGFGSGWSALRFGRWLKVRGPVESSGPGLCSKSRYWAAGMCMGWKRSGMTQTSAGVVCRQLGYTSGSVSTSPCSAYGGSNVCGSAGSCASPNLL